MTASEKNIIAQAFALLSSKSPGKVSIVTNNVRTEPNTKTVAKRSLNFTPKTRKVIVRTNTQAKASASLLKDPATLSPGQENTVPQQTQHSLLAKNLLLDEPKATKSKTNAHKRKEPVTKNKQNYFEVPIVDKLVIKDFNTANHNKATPRKDNASPNNTEKQITQNYVQVMHIDTPRPKAVAVPKTPIIIASPQKSKTSPQNPNINSHLKSVIRKNLADKNTSPIAELMNLNKDLVVTALSSDSSKMNLSITEDSTENTVCLLSDDEESPVNDKEITNQNAVEPPKETSNVTTNTTQAPEKPKKVRKKITKKRSVEDTTVKENHPSDKSTSKKQSKPGPARKKPRTSSTDVANNQENTVTTSSINTSTNIEENVERIKTPEANTSIQSFIVSDEEESIADPIVEPQSEQEKIIEIPESPEKDLSLSPSTSKLSDGEAKKGSRLNFEDNGISESCEEGSKMTEINAVIDDSGIDCNALTKEEDTDKEIEEKKCKKLCRRFVRRKKLVLLPNWMKSFEERRLATDNQIANALTSIATSLQELTRNIALKIDEKNNSMKELNSTLNSLKDTIGHK